MFFVSDVRFLYLVPGDGENFGELVHNPTTDIITYASLQTEDDTIRVINQVTDRIKEGKLSLHKQNSPFTTEKCWHNSKALNYYEH
jgi:hypothetical protein